MPLPKIESFASASDKGSNSVIVESNTPEDKHSAEAAKTMNRVWKDLMKEAGWKEKESLFKSAHIPRPWSRIIPAMIVAFIIWPIWAMLRCAIDLLEAGDKVEIDKKGRLIC